MTAKRSTKYSDADYAAMAASYEADPPRADEAVAIEVSPAVLRMGRPIKGVISAGKTPALPVRLPRALRVEIEGRVKAGESSTASELVRRAVVEYLERHPSNRTVEPPTERNSEMPKKNDNTRHVVPNPGGGWDVKKNDAQRASEHHGTQREAEKRAKEIVHNAGGGEVKIHDKKGRIRDSDTVAPGNDPFPPRDKKH